MAKDVYAIEMDTRDKRDGQLIRLGMYDSRDAAYFEWNKINVSDDPDVQWWLVRIREGIDDPAHVDAIECKCKESD